jgi:hypothetical protein
MRRRRRAQRVAQPDLFTPPPQRPIWNHLPRAARQNVVALLAELLRGHHVPEPLRPRPKEATDE